MRIWREVRNFAWHRWFSLQRCCKMLFRLFLLTRVVQNLCVCTMDFLSAGKKYYYKWPFAKKLYQVVPRLNENDDVIEWNFMKIAPPPEMKSWLRLCTKLYFMSKQKGSNCDSSLRRSIAYCWAKQSVRCCFITLKTTKIPGSFVQVADWRGRKRNLKIGAIHYLHPAPD